MRRGTAISAASLAVAAGAAVGAGATTERVSVGPGGAQARDFSSNPAISGEGAHVAFASVASNLVSADGNGVRDIFVRDRATGVTERASVGAAGAQANGASVLPVISEDGRFVAFESVASNLVAVDSNGDADIFLRDRAAGTTERVSVRSAGLQVNGPSSQPAIAGGRFVAFASAASNVVPGDTNGVVDVFLRDRVAGVTERVSVGAGAAQANRVSNKPAVSADGRYVAFASDATNLVSGDSNGARDVFVRDRQTGATRRVSVGERGAQGNGPSSGPVISADGADVAFTSDAENLVSGDRNEEPDVFVHERATADTRRVSVGPSGAEADGPSAGASISGGGGLVSFESAATNLVVSDTNKRSDVFVRDRRAAVTERASITAGGSQATSRSGSAAISSDGFAVAFESLAKNLITGDTNGKVDAFVRDRPRPVVGRTVSTVPTKGEVLVSVPAGSARAAATVPGIKGRKFVPLRDVREVPVGSLLDARKGTVKISSATSSGGATQSGDFAAGVFQVLQSRKRRSRGLTELRLKGSSFRRCGTARSSAFGPLLAHAALSRRTIRRLRGKAKGRFRTRGRHSAATIRGTSWTVSDRCDGTLTTVRRGKVAVRDFRRRRTILLRTGKRYLARARR